jgi:hypothetical protein
MTPYSPLHWRAMARSARRFADQCDAIAGEIDVETTKVPAATEVTTGTLELSVS